MVGVVGGGGGSLLDGRAPDALGICRSFSLGQNISNLCPSIYIFLTEYCDEIFSNTD